MSVYIRDKQVKEAQILYLGVEYVAAEKKCQQNLS